MTQKYQSDYLKVLMLWHIMIYKNTLLHEVKHSNSAYNCTVRAVYAQI